MEDEELFFKRFPEGKQDQVRQLVGFATLCGLTGEDLVSIGGKLARIAASQERKHRIAAVAGFEVKPVCGDRGLRHGPLMEAMHRRFKLETPTGDYTFTMTSYSDEVTIKSMSTGVKVDYTPARREWGRTDWRTGYRNDLLLAVYDGDIKLNF